MHGTPEQQSPFAGAGLAVERAGRREASVPPSGGGWTMPPSVPGGGVVDTPPSGRSVPPHTPEAEPAGSAQGRPLQQSAFDVHAVPCIWHVEPQTYGFVAFVAGSVLRRHGLPQQSALDAHCVPADRRAADRSSGRE